MASRHIGSSARREFLSFLAASPLLAYAGFTPRWLEEVLAPGLAASSGQHIDLRAGNPLAVLPPHDEAIITSVNEALTVMDFELAMRAKIPPAHFYDWTIGTFFDETVMASREGFGKYQIRLRRLTGVAPASVDTSVQIFGLKWDSPIFLCPIGPLRALDPDGYRPVARAAKAKRTLAMVGAGLLEDLNAISRGEPIWYQFNGAVNQDRIKQVEKAGWPAIVWTVDYTEGSNLEHDRTRQRYYTPADCNSCHGPAGPAARRGGGANSYGPGQTWSDVKRLKNLTSMKLVLKGIVTREDAELAVENGADAVVVSTHAGHVDAAGRGSIESLPEVVAGAAGRIPVFVDSGFRGGADVFKALALGATAVGVGRPYAWGLASFGQEGVETVIELLRRELRIVMAQAGATSIAKISRASLATRG
jgi:isopentenyl diphosphate isomerase/L-lactate dehydrogenase-like FMN-dependent dehydrogenase